MSTEAATQFNIHRPRLMAIAYRMLGSRAEAEDIVQDAYLRWHEGVPSDLRSTEAWLVTLVTRLSIDRLRVLKRERADYIGPWLPEPLVEEASSPSPESIVELASDLSVAFLAVLERLSPEERAAFLLREVFDHDYPDVASMLDKSEAACRQLVHRARSRVQEAKQRFSVSREAHIGLLERFIAAARSGERTQLQALFAADAQFVSDGGGKVIAVRKILVGGERIGRFFHVIARRVGDRFAYRHALVNGEPGLLRYIDGTLDAVYSFITDGSRIVAMQIVRNPDKLQALRDEFGTLSQNAS